MLISAPAVSGSSPHSRLAYPTSDPTASRTPSKQLSETPDTCAREVLARSAVTQALRTPSPVLTPRMSLNGVTPTTSLHDGHTSGSAPRHDDSNTLHQSHSNGILQASVSSSAPTAEVAPQSALVPAPAPCSSVAKSMLPPPALALVSSALLATGGTAASLAPAAGSGGNSASHGATCSAESAALAAAVAASKLGLADQLRSSLTTHENMANARDAEGRTCLHYAAGYGHEDCVDLLLENQADTRSQDCNGDVPLHFAAIHGHPMCAYNIGKACPAACLIKNLRGQTPIDVAVACERSEVLNAMLLACAGDTSEVAVRAMRKLLQEGAVPDTWAPNGSSALMLAASVDGTAALKVLLAAGASIKLQDALGRSALMFAAGNCAHSALVTLLEANACLAQRDRRGRSVLDYAPEGSTVRQVLEARLRELESVARQRQEDLLASLEEEDQGSGKSSAAGKSSGAVSNARDVKLASIGGSVSGVSAAQAPAAANGSKKMKAVVKKPVSVLADAATEHTAERPQHESAEPSSGAASAAVPVAAWSSPWKGASRQHALTVPTATEDSHHGVRGHPAACNGAHDEHAPSALVPCSCQQDTANGDDAAGAQSWQVVTTHRSGRKSGPTSNGASVKSDSHLSATPSDRAHLSGSSVGSGSSGHTFLSAHVRASVVPTGRASLDRKPPHQGPEALQKALAHGHPVDDASIPRQGSAQSLSSIGSCDSHSFSQVSSIGSSHQSRTSHNWGAQQGAAGAAAKAPAKAAANTHPQPAAAAAAPGSIAAAAAATQKAAAGALAGPQVPANAWTARKVAAAAAAAVTGTPVVPQLQPVTPATGTATATVNLAGATAAATAAASPVTKASKSSGPVTPQRTWASAVNPAAQPQNSSPSKPAAAITGVATASIILSSPPASPASGSPTAATKGKRAAEVAQQQASMGNETASPAPADTAATEPPSRASAGPELHVVGVTPAADASASTAASQEVDLWRSKYEAEVADKQAVQARMEEMSRQLAELQAQLQQQSVTVTDPPPAEAETEAAAVCTAEAEVQTTGPCCNKLDLAATEALVEQAVYMERIRIVGHLLSLGMTPTALVTLLSPLAASISAEAAHNAATAALMPSAARSRTPGASSSDQGVPLEVSGVATSSAAPSKPTDPALASKASSTHTSTPACGSDADGPTAACVSTPVAGLMKQPLKPQLSGGGEGTAVSAGLIELAPAAPAAGGGLQQPRQALDAAAAARTFAKTALEKDRRSPARVHPGAQSAGRPLTAAEAAAAHAASRRMQQPAPGRGVMPPPLSEAEITETISRICRPAPVVAPVQPSWDAGVLLPGCTMMDPDASRQAAAAAAASACRQLVASQGPGIQLSMMPSGDMAAAYGKPGAGLPFSGGVGDESGDPLPDCGDISVALAMSDDEEPFEGLQQAFAAVASKCPAPLAGPKRQSFDLGRPSVRAPSPSPEIASSFNSRAAGGLFAFMPAAVDVGGAKASAPVSIPTPQAFAAGSAPQPFAPAPGVSHASPAMPSAFGIQGTDASAAKLFSSHPGSYTGAADVPRPWDVTGTWTAGRNTADPCPAPKPYAAVARLPVPAGPMLPPSCPSFLAPALTSLAAKPPRAASGHSSSSQPLVSVMGFQSQELDHRSAPSLTTHSSENGVCAATDRLQEGARLPSKGGLSDSMQASASPVSALGDIQKIVGDLASIKTAPSAPAKIATGGSQEGAADTAENGLSVEDAVVPATAVRCSQACRSGVASPFGTSASPPLSGAGMQAVEQALGQPHAAADPAARPKQRVTGAAPPRPATAALSVTSPTRFVAMFTAGNNPLDAIRTGFAASATPPSNFTFPAGPSASREGTAGGARTACMPSPCGSPPTDSSTWGMWQSTTGARGAAGSWVPPATAVATRNSGSHARHASDSWALAGAGSTVSGASKVELPECL